MRAIFLIIGCVGVVSSLAVEASDRCDEPERPASATPDSTVSVAPTVTARLQALLDAHCLDCHSKDLQEAGLRFDNFSQQSKAEQTALLNRIEEQVYLRRMPPADTDSLPDKQHADFLDALQQQFEAHGSRSLFREKMKSPAFGNYVNHEQLFSGTINTPPYSPARLWRTSPYVFDNVKSQRGADPKHLRQPFIVDDRTGIRDYAALLFADSAVVDVLMSNAGKSADRLLETDPALRKLTDGRQPTAEQIQRVIEQQFRRVIYRAPTADETQRFTTLFQQTANEADSSEALRVMLMATMLHHESVYRLEIGLGAELPDGRRMLSPTELAFAISFALTDQPPDDALLQAVRSGGLRNRQDVRQQVTRLLQDDAISKPRILRFFQEFFGYAQAHKVFKDAKRSGGFSYYGENYPQMYERDADFFVMNILEDDHDVFQRLLTSDRYYILNRQTFRNTVYNFWRKYEQQIEDDILTDEMTAELLARLDLNSWDELNTKYDLHNFNKGFNGSVRAIKQIVKECRQWKNTEDEDKLLHGMQPLYKKYPMVYDLEDQEQDFLLPQPYQRPHRAGLLTHPAWLIAHSLNDATDPIRRGKWIRERLLADTVPDLPITVDATIPEDPHKTLRERMAVTEAEECWRCHRKMNPLGYPFEIYDDFGRYRTRETLDKLPKANGRQPSKPIDSSTQLTDSQDRELDGRVEDALDLIERLASSDRVRQSIIRHAFRYFLGRNERLSDSRTLIAADRAYLDSDGSFNALLVALLTSDSFLYRR